MLDKIKENKIFIFIFIIIVLIFSINHLSVILNEVKSEKEIIVEEEVEEKEVEKPVNTILVDVKGYVNKPGVYELKAGSRVNDAIEKAGGMTHNNTNCVNLSHKLEDEEVVYIPSENKMCITEEGEKVENNLTQNNLSETEKVESEKININIADENELQNLTGIGETKAQDIIKYREENGNFKTIEDIKNVSGIGESTYEKIKESIEV